MPTCLSAILNLPKESIPQRSLRPELNQVSNRWKRSKLVLLFVLTPFYFFGQTSLTGLWTGVFSNDSNTVRKEQSFEIALTEYKGKVYGYSRSEFIVNDTLYYIVKRVKGVINGDVCEVKDDEILAYNFPTRLDKGVKVTSHFYRSRTDSTWRLAGKWKTNQTKNYYSVTGKVQLAEEKDLTASKLFPHLEELNLANEIVFYKERKQQDVVMKEVEPEAKMFSSIRIEQQTSINDAIVATHLPGNVEVNTVQVTTTSAIRTNPELKRTSSLDIPVKTETPQLIAEVKTVPAREKTNIQTEEQKTELVLPGTTPSTVKVNTTDVAQVSAIRTNPELTRSNTLDIPVKTSSQPITAQVKDQPIREKTKIKTEEQKLDQPIAQKPVTTPTTDIVKTNPIKTSATNVVRTTPEVKKSGAATIPVKTEIASSKPNVLPETKKPESEPVIAKNTIPQKSIEEIIAPAKTIGGRNSEFSQTVNFKSDSLQLSLYDNGEIDGDTVSLFMNGIALLSKQGLKASAIKKTIYLPAGSHDEFTLVLFAENLGKYPPNTGLLVVRDGEDVYNVRFSADYQKNSGVVFRRKK